MTDFDIHEIDSKRQEMASDATLRDYFAAKAMQAIISNHQCYPLGMNFDEYVIAKAALRMADAIIEQRNK